jgi:cytochrome P450
VPSFNPLTDNLPAPWEPLAEDRAKCPYHEIGEGMFEAITHATVSETYRNHQVWSSRLGVDAAGQKKAGQQILSFADPPEHTRQRRLFVKALSPARMDAMVPLIQRVMDDIIDGLPPEGGTFDLFEVVANVLPAQIIHDLLGIPEESRAGLLRWTQLEVRAATSFDQAEFARDMAEYVAFLTGLVRERKADPAPHDDLISLLVSAEVDREVLLESEVVYMLKFLLSAGADTTKGAVTNAVYALETHPVEKQRYLADIDGLVDNFVEEALRFDGPVKGLLRTARVDTLAGDVPVPAGTKMYMCFVGANHDPAVYDRPDEFSLERDHHRAQPHVSFGAGIHHCLGMNLARHELRVMLATLYRRLPNLRLADGFAPEPAPALLWRHWRSMQVTFDGPVGPRPSPADTEA